MRNKALNFSAIFKKESEGGYTVIIPSLPGCVTYGETLEEAKSMAADAIQLYLESIEKNGDETPQENDVFYGQININP